jgi:hypothetical protein
MPRGRPTIFGSKNGGRRASGLISRIGALRFEEARQRLAKLAGWEDRAVSDGETIDYLARGEKATREFLKQKTS